MTMGEIRIYPDADLLMRAAAEYFVGLYETTITHQGFFSVALAGGSTPRALYSLLAGEMFVDHVDWSVVHFFWGDERCVPPDHETSNYRMARLALLDEVRVPVANIHRMRGELDPVQAAAEYEQTLLDFFKNRGAGSVRFDLVLLGLGEDGHTASLFPNTPVLDETERLVVANHVPALDAWRLTLSTAAINAARNVAFLISGAAKAVALQDVLEGPRQARELPAQLVNPTDGSLVWLLDEAAARLLTHKG
jgi:6-phosphogluconolactonase